jgi:hypothetical protein
VQFGETDDPPPHAGVLFASSPMRTLFVVSAGSFFRTERLGAAAKDQQGGGVDVCARVYV